MSFLMDLTRFVQTATPGKDSSTAPKGLDLVEEAIDDVIKKIDVQMELIEPQVFQADATIQRASFGGADSAPNLSNHYDRAHEVTWKTLDGLKKDLQTFQEACRTARMQVVRADEDSAQSLDHTRSAVEDLREGTTSHQGRYEHRRAQQNQSTTPTTDQGDDL